jgi:stage II sporulation protein E
MKRVVEKLINKSETFTMYNPAKEMTNITSIIIANILSFLLARAFILDGIMPFGIAFFGTALLNRFAVLSILSSMALGLVSIGGYNLSVRYLLASLLLLFVCRVLFRRKTLRRYQVSLITAISIFGVTLANVYAGGQLTLYNFFMLSFEALASGILVYIFDYAMSVIKGIDKRKLVSKEEFICVAVTCAIAVSGIGRVYLGDICIRTLVMAMLVLTSGYIGGPSVGSAAGVVFGVISGLATTSIAVIVGVFAFAGLLAGTFKELGRLGSALGFIIGSCILNFYIAGQMVTVISMTELLTGTLLFLLTPAGLINRFSSISSLDRTRMKESPSYSERVRELTSIRLKEFSKVFGQLAATFENITFREGFRDSAGIDKLMDGICGRACNGCSLYRSCWDREFYTIYQAMFELISIAEENGFVEIKDIPGRLKVKCIRPQQIIDAVNYLYDMHRINYKWQVRMEDCRNMVSQQLEGISRVVERLAAEVNADLDFNEAVEDNIRIELDKQGLQVSKLTVLERADKKMEVFIEKKACYGCRECSKKILPAITEATGRKFTREGSFALRFGIQYAYIGQIPVLFGIIQTITHNKFILDYKTGIINLNIYLTPLGLVQ